MPLIPTIASHLTTVTQRLRGGPEGLGSLPGFDDVAFAGFCCADPPCILNVDPGEPGGMFFRFCKRDTGEDGRQRVQPRDSPPVASSLPHPACPARHVM